MIPGLLNQKNNKPSLERNNQFVEVFIYNKAAATKRGIDGVQTQQQYHASCYTTFDADKQSMIVLFIKILAW